MNNNTLASEIIAFLVESAPKAVINQLTEQAKDMLDCGKTVDSTLNDMSGFVEGLCR